MKVKNLFADYILCLRQEQKLNQKFIADLLEIKIKDLENWESGYTYPSKKMIEKLALLYEVEASELLKIIKIEKSQN